MDTKDIADKAIVAFQTTMHPDIRQESDEAAPLQMIMLIAVALGRLAEAAERSNELLARFVKDPLT